MAMSSAILLFVLFGMYLLGIFSLFSVMATGTPIKAMATAAPRYPSQMDPTHISKARTCLDDRC